MERRLMILGTRDELVTLAKRAKERGYYTVVCDNSPDGEGRKYADKGYLADVREIDRIASICVQEKIDHIVTSFSDLMFECMVEIAAKAGIPCYVTPDQLDAYRRKPVTKALCKKLGIGVPKFELLDTDYTDDDIKDFQFPCIIKPTDAYGNKGIHVVHSREQLRAEFDDASAYSSGKPGALLEEISKGQELNFMGFVAEGKVYPLCVVDRMTTPLDEDHIPYLYAIHYPSVRFDEIEPKITQALQKFVDETGQKWGPLSSQFFYHDGKIEICEIAGRILAFEYELIELFSDVDVIGLLLDLQYDREHYTQVLKEHNAGGVRFASGIYLNSAKAGRLSDQHIIEEFGNDPIVKRKFIFYKEGEEVGILGPKNFFAVFFLCARTREEVADAEKAFLARAAAYAEDGTQLLLKNQDW